MTSEIEAKRKELKEKIIIRQDNIKDYYGYNYGKLEGFNLGVSLAQKEFLDFLKLLLADTGRAINNKEKQFMTAIAYNVWILSKIEDKINELKQFLWEKQ